MPLLGGSHVSAQILLYSSAGAVMLAAFGANSMFMMFLGRVKELAIIAIVAAGVVIGGGIYSAGFGFENIVLAYLAGAAAASVMSTAVMAKTIGDASSRLFSRYV
jgi:hypothetical protein